ncbi:two-component system sensor histidine kinase NtrB [Halobellus limi]|uniref:histidine kinase n=1 Tax=Halobellus limi TaxID=699433 RepID=A0A1H6CK50_9EURY|nr:PAS domain-containing sensor histidine kinase [Halobellus limi]QCC46219.1 PAS domain S-box protein [Halobellus limi]SEG73123.1 PAS domain S-box-containing protein [Halobellus limi]
MNSHSLPAGSEEFYRTLVESAAEGMLTIDAESTIVYANPAVEDILGYAPEELVGSSKMKIIPERLRPVHAAALDTYVRTGERSIDWEGIELPALHKDGHEVPTLISLREHTHDGDRYFTGIIRDVTERRRREDELRDQKERLDEFADILAHDIRNPLSVARGYTELAREREQSPELAQVEEALDRIDRLVDDVLALSREGRFIGETGPVDLETSLRAAWGNVETGRATLEVEPGLGVVVADGSRLAELFENLFRNAVEHGTADPEGVGSHSLTVNAGRLPEGEGFYVADDGDGIPEAEREAIFERGYSTRESGTGYGLSIVRQLAEAHGWTIGAAESDGSGARFEIRDVAFEG